MKRTNLIFFLLSLIAIGGVAQKRIIVNPAYEVKNTGIGNVAKIELTDTATLLTMHITFVPHWWTTYDSTEVIRDCATGTEYKVKKLIGGEFNKYIWMPDSGDSTVVLVFPPLPASVKKIDYNKQILGISLSPALVGTRKPAGILPSIDKWIKEQLNKAPKNTLANYELPSFFNEKQSRLIGCIKGYDTRLGFTTGIIYGNNTVTREDYPIVVKIEPDGRFEAEIPMIMPGYTWVVFNEQSPVPFYLEPGQTLCMILDWDEFLTADRKRNIRYTFSNIEYRGALASLNKELLVAPTNSFDYKVFDKKRKTMAPLDFKADQLKEYDNRMAQYKEYIQKNRLSEKAKTILRNKIMIANANNLFNYTMSRDYYARQDSTNKILKTPVPVYFYDFLKQMPLNDPSLLVCNEFSEFINRFEYNDLFSKLQRQYYIDLYANQPKPENNISNHEIEIWKLKDRTLQNELDLSQNLVYEITKVRSLDFLLKNASSKENAADLWNSLKEGIKTPYLIQTGQEMLVKAFPDTKVVSQALPNNAGADIFRKIINPFKGKVLFIDFWATTCGPCVSGIKQMKATRAKYAANPDFDFIFITDQRSSPEKDYNDFVKDQELKNINRISTDDFNQLRQLFKFNGIPRYVVIDKNGDVINSNFSMWNFETELGKIIPAYNK
ncbi:MAG: thioredoxin family protein [Paludibacter sp.]|nr:thioredoxin family protein [Paludibacter sp.]